MKKFILTLIFMAIVKLIFSQELTTKNGTEIFTGTSTGTLINIPALPATSSYTVNISNIQTDSLLLIMNISGYSYFDVYINNVSHTVAFNDTLKISNTTATYTIITRFGLNNLSGFYLTVTNNGVATGIADLKLNTSKLTVFPNPAIDEVNVSFTANKEKTPIEVFDIQGRLVMLEETEREIGVNKVSLNISNFSAGIYIVRAGSETFKITKI